MSEQKTVTFIVTRQDDVDSDPYQEEFEVPYRPNINVIAALMEIRRNPVNKKGEKTTPVIWDMNCLRRGLRCLFNGDKWKTSPIVFGYRGSTRAANSFRTNENIPCCS